MRCVLLAVVVVVLTIGPAHAVDKEAVNAAIDRGVASLKKMQDQDGAWSYSQQPMGSTSLVALTLLECGVPKNDRSIQKAAKVVRNAGLRLSSTYSLSLAILFLDRLGQVEDTPLIESMLVRLMAGQDASGGWTYECVTISDAEVKRVTDEMQSGKRVLRGGGRDLSKMPEKGKRTSEDLPKEIQAQLKVVAQAAARPAMGIGADNSNTQFATLALWVGRRYGVPTQAALKRIDQRFRSSQSPAGEWGYTSPPGGLGPMMAMIPMRGQYRGTMTCAGLLGLACGHGASVDTKRAKAKDDKITADVSRDANIKAGLKVLADNSIGKPLGWTGTGVPPKGIPAASGKAYYFFWSLERVAVILGLETIGKKDWYNWGAEVILANEVNGTWHGEYGTGGVDTCFALLFLKRSNLAEDLTRSLSGGKKLGGRSLHAGGVGASSLSGSKPATSGLSDVGIGAKPPPDKKPATGSSPRLEKPKPGAATENAATRLTGELMRATGEARAGIIKSLRDGRGGTYTEALAAVIPKLDGDTRQKTRDALADRLTRMKPITLREYLKDKDAELRRAAALAAGQKDARSLAPDLIRLLEDEEIMVRRAAQAALKEFAGADLGPRPGANEAERKKAIAAWQAWWKKQARE
jgi:hypothetical protein